MRSRNREVGLGLFNGKRMEDSQLYGLEFGASSPEDIEFKLKIKENFIDFI